MTDWITDRLPTKADGNSEGDVLVREPTGKRTDLRLHWHNVMPGWPWRHSEDWSPQPRKVPRGFLAFFDMPRNTQGGPERTVVAIATDHTAWYREPDRLGGDWSQVPSLPDREEPLDA